MNVFKNPEATTHIASVLVTDGIWWYPQHLLPCPENNSHPYFRPGDGVALAKSLKESGGISALLSAFHLPIAVLNISYRGCGLISSDDCANRELSCGTYSVFHSRRILQVSDAIIGMQRNGNNYYHFIQEILPSLIAWEGRIPALYSKEKLAVFSSSRFAAALLRLAGFNNAIIVERPSLIFAQNTTFIRLLPAGYFQKGLHKEVADRIITSAKQYLNWQEKGAEVIFVSRPKTETRRLVNEVEVIQVIQDRFSSAVEVIYPGILTVEEQVCRMINARIVIATHGAQTTNILWATRMEHFIEISTFWPTEFGALADTVIGSSIHHIQSHAIQPGNHYSDHKCDVESLKLLLKRL